MHAVAPQHHIAARALRRLGCEGGGENQENGEEEG